VFSQVYDQAVSNKFEVFIQLNVSFNVFDSIDLIRYYNFVLGADGGTQHSASSQLQKE
jgi:hypothetical protein